MKFSSVIFLVLLLAQLAVSKKDDIKVFDKSHEGKQILDSIYLKNTVQGDTLNVQSVNAILNNFEQQLSNEKKEINAHLTISKENCKNDINDLKKVFHDLVTRALTTGRHLKEAEGRDKRRKTFLTRAEDELSIYKRFWGYVNENEKALEAFYMKATGNVKMCKYMLSSIDSLVAHFEGSSLIELPGTYKSNLAQITEEFESTYDNFGGMRAIISNVLQIASKSSAMKKDSVRQGIQSLIRHIQDRLFDMENQLEQEHAHQSGLFESLHSLFHDAVEKAQNTVTDLKIHSSNAQLNIAILNAATKNAENIADRAKSIVEQRSNECREDVKAYSNAEKQDVKLLSAIGFLRDILVDGWESFAKTMSEGRN